jgi:hypothetical protein
MRNASKLAALVAAGALAIAVPAAAKGPHPDPADHPSHPSHPATEQTHPGTSEKCTVHNVAYIASGTLVSWAASQTGTDTYTGTITVDVTKTNHHAKAQKGTQYSYTLDNSKVVLGKGANPPAAGDRVTVIGEITEVAKKCKDQSGEGTITVRKVSIRVPKDKK